MALTVAGHHPPAELCAVDGSCLIIIPRAHNSFQAGRSFFMRRKSNRPVVYLDRPIKVKLIRWLQRVQRIGKRAVVVRHAVLADRLGCSESTVKRAVRELSETGHILKEHIRRPTKGGFLCAYRVRTDVIYRVASFARQANDLLPAGCEMALHRHLEVEKEAVSEEKQNSDRYRRKAHSSINPRLSIKDLLTYARIIGIDNSQRGYLALLARKYGVYDAWEALRIAIESGRALNPVAYAWGIARKWYRKEALAT